MSSLFSHLLLMLAMHSGKCHTAIFFVMCLQSFSVNCVYLRIALVLHAMAEKRVQDCIAMVLITPCNILHVTSNYRG